MVRTKIVQALIVAFCVLCFTNIAAAYTPATFSIGNTNAINTNTTDAITYLYKEADLPLAPIGLLESTASSWSDVWHVTNGGDCVLSEDGINGEGDLNEISFHLYRVSVLGVLDYYVIEINAYTANDNDGIACTYWPAVVTATANPGDHVDMTYDDNTVSIVVKDPLGLTTANTSASFYFTANSIVRRVYSPMMQIGMDTDQTYAGCEYDVPGNDDLITNLGHYREHNMYGTSAPGIANYVYSPTSNAHCSLQRFHYPILKYDVIQWHVDGI